MQQSPRLKSSVGVVNLNPQCTRPTHKCVMKVNIVEVINTIIPREKKLFIYLLDNENWSNVNEEGFSGPNTSLCI